MEACRTYNAYISTRLQNMSYLEIEKMQEEADLIVLYTGFIFRRKSTANVGTNALKRDMNVKYYT